MSVQRKPRERNSLLPEPPSKNAGFHTTRSLHQSIHESRHLPPREVESAHDISAFAVIFATLSHADLWTRYGVHAKARTFIRHPVIRACLYMQYKEESCSRILHTITHTVGILLVHLFFGGGNQSLRSNQASMHHVRTLLAARSMTSHTRSPRRRHPRGLAPRLRPPLRQVFMTVQRITF